MRGVGLLGEQGQLDVDAFNLVGCWSRRGTDSVCPTRSMVVSGGNAVSGIYHSVVHHGIESTSCQAEREFSELAHLIGDLRSSMLTSKDERMMFIRLNTHLIDEVRQVGTAVAQARARVAKSVHIFVAVQEERSNMSVDL